LTVPVDVEHRLTRPDRRRTVTVTKAVVHAIRTRPQPLAFHHF
jgi:hypothetical protein